MSVATGELSAPAGVDPRAWHYGDFYGLRPRPDDDRPIVLVHGNCQAEALRVLLSTSAGAPCRTVRLPPVHELVRADLPHLARLLGEARAVVSQPVRDDWGGLPLGTRQVVAAAPHARVVVVPIVRYRGLHPYQALVRVPGAGEPPVVPYHDLRTLRAAAGGTRPPGRATPDAYRAAADDSVAELRRREERHGAVPVADLLRPAGAAAAHTINHPGNVVLVGLARRVQEAAGWPADAADPGRELLGSVDAPVQHDVLDALGLEPHHARTAWTVAGQTISPDDVTRAQLAWYADHPDVVSAGLARHAAALSGLGLGLGLGLGP